MRSYSIISKRDGVVELAQPAAGFDSLQAAVKNSEKVRGFRQQVATHGFGNQAGALAYVKRWNDTHARGALLCPRRRARAPGR